MKNIEILSLLSSPLLNGATRAQLDLPKFVEELTKVNKGEMVTFDFKGVEQVSASYWNSIVPAIYSFASDEEREVFPIICNVERNSLEDLELALKNRGIAVLVANKKTGGISELKLFGVIDDAHKETFILVNSHGEIGSGDLVSKEEHKEGNIGLSGWNNRLATLYRMRLIRRVKRGRSFRYKPVIEV